MCTLGNLSVRKVRILLFQVFKFNRRNRKRMVSTRSIVQAQELEKRYNEEVKLRKEAGDALASKNEEMEVMNRLHKEEQGQLKLNTRAMEQKHQKEKVNLKVAWLENENEKMHLKAEVLEGKYKGELSLRKETETALRNQSKELEETKQLLEACNVEQENLTTQVRTWQERHDQESRLKKETEDALSREKQELETVKVLLESSKKETDAMRQERDNALLVFDEMATKQAEERQPPPSFICPISQEVMKDPHLTADGHSYEAEDIKEWFSTGHDTSPITNLKLPHCHLVPNRALRSAIQDLV